MPKSVFGDKSAEPNDELLAEALGERNALWEDLKARLRDEYGDLNEEWKFYSPKFGWTLKMLRKKRNLFFFTPFEGYFSVAFVFGDKAVAAAEKSDISEEIIDSLRSARKYAEGRGIQIEVRTPEDVANTMSLVRVKVNN